MKCDPLDFFSHDLKPEGKWEQPTDPEGNPLHEGEYRWLVCKNCDFRIQESRPPK